MALGIKVDGLSFSRQSSKSCHTHTLEQNIDTQSVVMQHVPIPYDWKQQPCQALRNKSCGRNGTSRQTEVLTAT